MKATIPWITLFCAGHVAAQAILTGPAGSRPILFTADQMVLESGEPRQEIPCDVKPIAPVLGFDLKLHAGYSVSVPLSELAGHQDTLTVLFRVEPKAEHGEPVYFVENLRVPLLADGAEGAAVFQGGYDLGEGAYRVSWLLRDRGERFCSAFWDVQASLPEKGGSIPVGLRPGGIATMSDDEFQADPPVERVPGRRLNVKVLMNFAPQRSGSAALQATDTVPLLSILRCISRDPRIGKFSLTLFNLDEQSVIYRQGYTDRIDFPALGTALSNLNLGTVKIDQLKQKHPDTLFLADLVKHEMEDAQADALIFAGPKALLDSDVPKEELAQIESPKYPVFYLNYNLDPRTTPWKDTISHIVKFFRGREFSIQRPRDVWFAVSETISRTLALAQTRGETTVADTAIHAAIGDH
jgi:hypothetical protein